MFLVLKAPVLLLKNERTQIFLLAFEVRLPATPHTPLNRVCMISYGNGEVNKKGANTYNECLPWLLPRNLIEVWQVGRCSLKLSALQILLDHVIAITWINRVYVITYAVINTRNVNFFSSQSTLYWTKPNYCSLKSHLDTNQTSGSDTETKCNKIFLDHVMAITWINTSLFMQ